MSVPEAAVDEYDGTVFRQDDVRSAGESLDIDTVPELSFKQGLSQLDFGIRVVGTNTRHNIVPLLYGNIVGHMMKKTLVLLYSQ